MSWFFAMTAAIADAVGYDYGCTAHLAVQNKENLSLVEIIPRL